CRDVGSWLIVGAGTPTIERDHPGNGGRMTNRISLPVSRRTLVSLLMLLASTFVLCSNSESAQLKLTWIDNSPNETGFALERRGSMDPFAQIAVVGPNVTSFADSGLTPGATYCYRVRAFNSAGWSPYTNEACGIATDMLSVGLNASAFTVGQTV